MASGTGEKIGRCQRCKAKIRTFVLWKGEWYFYEEANKISNLRRNALWQKESYQKG